MLSKILGINYSLLFLFDFFHSRKALLVILQLLENIARIKLAQKIVYYDYFLIREISIIYFLIFSSVSANNLEAESLNAFAS